MMDSTHGESFPLLHIAYKPGTHIFLHLHTFGSKTGIIPTIHTYAVWEPQNIYIRYAIV